MSQTVLLRATELSGQLGQLRRVQLAAQRRAITDQLLQELVAVRERLQAPIEFLIAGQSREELAQLRIAVPDLTSARASVDRARRSLQSNPEAPVGRSVVAPVVGAASQAAQAAETSARAVWREIVAAMGTAARPEVLEVLERIPRYRGAVARLRSLELRIRGLAGARWVSGTDLEAFLALQRATREEWEQLGGTDALPGDVLDFLGACARGGAALEAMTPAIAEWIGKQDLASAFRIQFSGG